MAGPLGQPSLAELRPMGRARPGSVGLTGATTDYDDDHHLRSNNNSYSYSYSSSSSYSYSQYLCQG